MDFPLFFLDYLGNRMLMAIIAVLHVMINHPLAIGAYPLVVLMEWWGRRSGNPDWDTLAYKITFVLFVVTTTVGALTGVGIWLSAALIAPFGIGSLLRIFFWAWFTEWLVFITEVVLILVYFLMWKRWTEGWKKTLHISTGVALAVFSWFTMAIIVAILGFMMGIGSWSPDQGLLHAFFNPLYLPQLAFRTAFAMFAAGLFAWLLIYFFTKPGTDFRDRAVRLVSLWVLGWTPFVAAGAGWYRSVVPEAMASNMDVALMTQAFATWSDNLTWIFGGASAVILLVALAGLTGPRRVPGILLIVPFMLGLYMLGHFERAREFIRKPHVVADYMYSNGVTMSELPVFQRDGILRYATYVKQKQVTPSNMVQAGQDVFAIACSRCHTSTGFNGVVNKFENLYGPEPWDGEALAAFIPTMHVARTFMPPFPGNEEESQALVAYLKDLQLKRGPILGAQSLGVPAPVQSTSGSTTGTR